MRVVILVPAVFLALSSCVELPLDPAEIPVVIAQSEFSRFYQNGTRWEPAFPGFHGCPDAFEIEKGDQRILVSEQYVGDVSDALAAASLPQRDPEAYYRNQDLALPTSLPFERVFAMGNVAPFNVTLRIDNEGAVWFNGAEIRVGTVQSHRFDYQWRRSDGELLDVTEHVEVEFVGIWMDPIEYVEPRGCD